MGGFIEFEISDEQMAALVARLEWADDMPEVCECPECEGPTE